ncbi:MAG TPA: rhodanese-like domain-containing protein [Terriglobales bacterium]|jgi:rhodanese-related sulfurtransferase|nr:rhodanese-like domain-containing protein [Terriglobales bacterium]
MGLTLTIVCAAGFLLLIVLWIRRAKSKDAIEKYRITPEVLRDLMRSNREVLIFDVRQPLDLLANSEIIPGAKRIPPKEVLENPGLIPKDKDSVVYCTCPSDKTSREVLHRALSLNFSRIKFLSGGLAGWKAKGYPVEQYTESFHLDTAT